MSFLIVLIALVGSASGRTVTIQKCLQYEPDQITLTGIIKRQSFAGPPNYESVTKGDQPEISWVLLLAKPICVTANRDWEEEKGVDELQLVFPEAEKQYEKYRSLLSRSVVVEGTLFHAHTGHHHTKLLLTVKSVKRKRW